MDLIHIQVEQDPIPDIIHRHGKVADPFAVYAVYARLVFNEICQERVNVGGIQRGNAADIDLSKERFKRFRRFEGDRITILNGQYQIQLLIDLCDEPFLVEVLDVDLLRQRPPADKGKSQLAVPFIDRDDLNVAIIALQVDGVFVNRLKMRPCLRRPRALANEDAVQILANLRRNAEFRSAHGVILRVQYLAIPFAHCSGPPSHMTR